jgi:hypothetical protein
MRVTVRNCRKSRYHRFEIRYLLTRAAPIVVTTRQATLYSTPMPPRVITPVQTRPRRRLGLAADEPARPLDAATDFAQWVQLQLDGPVLRYSARLLLLQEAQRRNLGRFEANLIIAGVLHRAGMAQEYEMRPRRSEWLAPLLTFVILQSTLLLGAWWVLA